MENLRFIRESMQSATSFTAQPGWGMVLVGLTAFLTAAVASRARGTSTWLGAWLVEAVLAVAISTVAIVRKSRASAIPLRARPTRRFVLLLLPPWLAAATLTPVLAGSGFERALPGMWMLLYGAGVVTAGAFSIRIVPLLGAAFMVAGGVALWAPVPRDALMAATFGGLHVGFGFVIARRHGG